MASAGASAGARADAKPVTAKAAAKAAEKAAEKAEKAAAKAAAKEAATVAKAAVKAAAKAAAPAKPRAPRREPPRQVRFVAERPNHVCVIAGTGTDRFTVADPYDVLTEDRSIRAQVKRRGPTFQLKELDEESDDDDDDDDEEDSDDDGDDDEDEEESEEDDDNDDEDDNDEEEEGDESFEPISCGTTAQHDTAVWKTPDKRHAALHRIDPKLDHLLVHQQDSVEVLQQTPQVSMLCWELGAGKTLGGFTLGRAYARNPSKRRVVIVCPISLIQQWLAYILAAPHPFSHRIIYDIVGADEWERMANADDSEELAEFLSRNVACVVVDEMQRFRRGTDGRSLGLAMHHCAASVVYLTGTPFVNDRQSLLGFTACMANVTGALQKYSLPELWRSFLASAGAAEASSRSIHAQGRMEACESDEEVKGREEEGGRGDDDDDDDDEEELADTMVNLTPAQVRRAVQGRISFFTPEDFPSFAHQYPYVTTQHLNVPMSPAQLLKYLAFRRERFDVQLNIRGRQHSFTISNGRTGNSCNIRLLENTDTPFPEQWSRCPKLVALVEQVKRREYPQVVYTRFREHGIQPVVAALKAQLPKNVHVDSITGSVSSSKRGEIIKQFNSGKLQVLVLSRAGAVGVDLHGAAAFHSIGPCDNDEERRQAQGRVERFGSHKSKPGHKRRVEALYYVSQFPSGTSMSEDEKGELLQTLAEISGDDVWSDEGVPSLRVVAATKSSPLKTEMASSLLRHLMELAASRETDGQTIDVQMLQSVERKRGELQPLRDSLRSASIPMGHTQAWARRHSVSPDVVARACHGRLPECVKGLRRLFASVPWPVKGARMVSSWENWSKAWPELSHVPAGGVKRLQYAYAALDACLLVVADLLRERADDEVWGDGAALLARVERVLAQLASGVVPARIPSGAKRVASAAAASAGSSADEGDEDVEVAPRAKKATPKRAPAAAPMLAETSARRKVGAAASAASATAPKTVAPVKISIPMSAIRT